MADGSGTGSQVTVNSYGSLGEVQVFTKHLLGGQSAFNSTTTPTSTQVQKFVDRVSGLLNVALSKGGFSVPVTQSDALLACDDFVVTQAARYVELTQRGVGYSEGEGSRTAGFANLHAKAEEFVKNNALGFKRLGVTVGHQSAEGLSFTAQTAPADRADPDDTSLAQPKFKRGLFSAPGGSGYMSGEDED